ncbi:hypothetical protein AX15_005988 [Amanita polypyramis BW_CC]|nr:hypothetical protein AX15_005988 [Amanita polypyramis BW_CC]
MKTVTRNIVRIQLSKGLQNLDNNYDLLSSLYEKLQLASLDVSNLDMDILTFANYACDFSVIVKTVHRKRAEVYEVERNKPEEYELSSVVTSESIIGFVYLTFSSDKSNPSETSELNMGIVIDSEHQREGYARRAIKIYLNRAFKLYKCYRIQATIVDPFSAGMFPAYKTFIATGFKQEGIRRSAHYNYFESTWQDVAYLAMLNTEWAMRSGLPKEREFVTTWEEMLNRHQMESDKLGRIENTQAVVRADWHAEM